MAEKKNILTYTGLKKLVVDEDEVDIAKISIGCIVTVFDVEYNEEIEFAIVGSTEANSLNHKLSNESPVGAALLGKKKNDMVEVKTPGGIAKYKVLSITK